MIKTIRVRTDISDKHCDHKYAFSYDLNVTTRNSCFIFIYFCKGTRKYSYWSL